MKYYVVAEVRSCRQGDHVRRLIPQIKVDVIAVKEDTDMEIIIKKKQDACHEVDSGHLSFDYVNFNASS